MAAKSSTRARGLDAATRICVLHGAEPMLKRQHLQRLGEVMHAEHGAIETVNFDGTSAELADVLDELRSYGLMQQYKLVVVDDADQFITRYRPAMERYAASPVDNGTLVLRCVRWNRGKLDEAIKKVGCLIKCEALTRPQAAQWLVGRARDEHGRKLDAATAMVLVRRLGVDLMRLDSEVAKLALLVGEQEPIGSDLIDQVVGRGSDEQAWAVQEALLSALTSPGSAPAPGRAPDSSSSRRAGAPTAGGAAIEKIHELVDLSGQPAILVAYFIADLIRKLHLALMMKRQGVAEGQIARVLKIWPRERQTLFMGLLRRLNERSTAAIFDQIVELDARSKSGFGDSMRNLERFCVSLADKIE